MLLLLWSCIWLTQEELDAGRSRGDKAGAEDADGDGFLAADAGGQDCDDGDAAVHPGAEEGCDGRDQDCDGAVDEGLLVMVHVDADGDGFGAEEDAREACAAGAGESEQGGDCDDGDPAVHPEAEETCDGADQDCDGEVDEGLVSWWYADEDGDGYGMGEAFAACELPVAASEVDGDCDDGDATRHPGALEACDGIDQDCDGEAEERLTWYADGDGDGFGDPATEKVECEAPPAFVAEGGDCDDGDPERHPLRPERCGDAVDEDCDGSVCSTERELIPGDVASYRYDGADPSQLLGTVVAVGEERGGRALVLVGSHKADQGILLDVGQVWAFSTDLLSATTNTDGAEASLHGQSTSGNLGWGIEVVPDMDLDGATELLIGAWRATDPDSSLGEAEQGMAWLVTGRELSGGEHGVGDVAELELVGLSPEGRLGYGLAACDLDGDADLELIAGEPGGTTGDSRQPPGGLLVAAPSGVSWTQHRLLAGTAGLHAGYQVHCAEDLTGDGLPDLLVGAAGDLYSPAAGADVSAFGVIVISPEDLDLSGATPLEDQGLWIWGEDLGDPLGSGLASAGDLNGDGLAEVAIGEYNPEVEAGRVWFVQGPLGASAPVGELSHASIEDTAPLTRLGRELVPQIDVDRDGWDDAVVSAAETSNSSDGLQDGSVHVFLGPFTGRWSTAEASFTLVGAGQESLGSASAVGDVDGDGWAELLVGSPRSDLGGLNAGSVFVFGGL